MTLNQIRYFATIARCQNFHRAADALQISQPSLSRSMNTLEAELDLILFERKGRNIVLTKYGRLFLEHAEQILNEVRIAEQKMKKLSGKGGHIDIAYVFPLANHYIPHMVRRFLDISQNRHVTFSFNQTITADLVDGLKSGRYDVIFGAYTENEPEIRFIPLLKQEMVLLIPKDHPLSGRGKVPLSVLDNYPVIGYDRVSGMGRETDRIYKKFGLHPDIICECPDENAIAALVKERFGIALTASVDTLSHIDVEILHPEEDDLFHMIYMGYLKDKYRIPAVNRFIRFIREEGISSAHTQ